MSAHHERMFQWVNQFNPYDLYSKGAGKPNVQKLMPYYLDLFAEFFPNEIDW